MANRIIVATLYQTGKTYLLNVSPRTLSTYNPGDSIYLIVKLDGSVTKGSRKYPTAITCTITATPFTGTPTLPVAVDTPTLVGTLASVNGETTYQYTLTVKSDGHDFQEDPQIQVNPD